MSAKQTLGLVVDARGLGLAHAGRGIGRVIVELLEGFSRLGVVADVAGPEVVRKHLGPTLRFVEKPARHWHYILSHGDLHGDRVLRLAPYVPGPLDARTVACCYDLMPLKEPYEHYPLRTRVRHPLAWPAMRHAFDVFPRAHRVWTISKTTALDLASMLGVSSSKIRPIPLAAPAWARPATADERAAMRARHGLPERYVAWVLSGLNPNKNVDGMLRAVAAARELPPLVVAGSFAQYSAAAFAAVAEKAGARFRSLGRVSDEDLRAFLGEAACVAVPSRDEGYALPIAEALACGGEVVANDIPVLRELAHPRVTYADAGDARAFGAALLAVASTPTDERTGRDVAAPRRTWDDVAREVYELATS